MKLQASALRLPVSFFLLILTSAAVATEPPLKVGDEVQVSSPPATVTYPGTIDRVGDGKYFVKFRGAIAPPDGWVEAARITRVSSAAAAPPLPYRKGARVEVSSRGSWYPASVLEVSGARAKVRYDGYDSSWDEWVGADRLRSSSAPSPQQGRPVGRFICQSFEAGQLHNQGELVLEEGGRYRDLTTGTGGTWRFNSRTRAITFTGVLANGAQAAWDASDRRGAITFTWPNGATRSCYR